MHKSLIILIFLGSLECTLVASSQETIFDVSSTSQVTSSHTVNIYGKCIKMGNNDDRTKIEREIGH